MEECNIIFLISICISLTGNTVCTVSIKIVNAFNINLFVKVMCAQSE